MDYLAEMRKHLAEAQRLDAQIEVWETWAEGRVEETETRYLAGFKDPQHRRGAVIGRMKKLLENFPLYGSRVSNRNHHLQAAQTYALVVLAEATVPPNVKIGGEDPRRFYG